MNGCCVGVSVVSWLGWCQCVELLLQFVGLLIVVRMNWACGSVCGIRVCERAGVDVNVSVVYVVSWWYCVCVCERVVIGFGVCVGSGVGLITVV